ncbi:MAG: hypothetical protein STHCBS139747_004537 [Sporothrix thermara]
MAPRLLKNTLVAGQVLPLPISEVGNVTVFTPHDSPYMPQNVSLCVKSEKGVKSEKSSRVGKACQQFFMHRDVQDVVSAYTMVAVQAPSTRRFKTLFANVSGKELLDKTAVLARLPEAWRFGLHGLHTEICNAICQYLVATGRGTDARKVACQANLLAHPEGMAMIAPAPIPHGLCRQSFAVLNRRIFSFSRSIELKPGFRALALYLQLMGRHAIVEPLFGNCRTTISRKQVSFFEQGMILRDSPAEQEVRVKAFEDIRRLDRYLRLGGKQEVVSREEAAKPKAASRTPSDVDNDGTWKDLDSMFNFLDKRTSQRGAEKPKPEESPCVSSDIDDDGTWDNLESMFGFMKRREDGGI